MIGGTALIYVYNIEAITFVLMEIVPNYDRFCPEATPAASGHKTLNGLFISPCGISLLCKLYLLHHQGWNHSGWL